MGSIVKCCVSEIFQVGKINTLINKYALSRNVPVGIVNDHDPVNHFTMKDLNKAWKEHNIWSKVIIGLESGEEENLPQLHIAFSKFFISSGKLLCTHDPKKGGSSKQLIIPENLVPVIFSLIHDMPSA